jgi:hypothetical protein
MDTQRFKAGKPTSMKELNLGSMWGQALRSGSWVAVLLACGLSCGRSHQAIRIDSGGSEAYKDSENQTWNSDTHFSGGVIFKTKQAVAETKEPGLYQTARYGNSFRYSIPVPNGPVTVRLKFAEIYFDGPGKRVFNVSINNAPVLTKFDPAAEAGGPFRAIDKEFTINVSDRQVNIQFSPLVQDPVISAIEVLP